MTIEIEDPGIVVAICDQCGDRRVLGLDPEADKDDIDDAIFDIAWLRNKPEKVRFGGGFGEPMTVEYPQDFCVTCQTAYPSPTPHFGRAAPRHPKAADAFANDPCDEWPRNLVFDLVGLRSECGHPRHGRPFDSCAWCEAGYPIGSIKAPWLR